MIFDYIGDVINEASWRVYTRIVASLAILTGNPFEGMEGAIYIGLLASLLTVVTGGALVFLILLSFTLFTIHFIRAIYYISIGDR